jgi:hypothetical protein
LAGGVPGQGVAVEGVKGVKHTPMPPEIYENCIYKKQAVSHIFWLIKRHFLLKSTEQDILPRRFLRNTSILKFFITEANVELYLFKVSEVLYAPQPPGLG